MAVLNLSVLPKESDAIAAQVAEKRKNRQPLCFEQAAGHLAIINVFPRPYSVVFAFAAQITACVCTAAYCTFS